MTSFGNKKPFEGIGKEIPCSIDLSEPMVDVIKKSRNALKCEKNGWRVGDSLEVDGQGGKIVILITAIGETHVLARQTHFNGHYVEKDEQVWNLEFREWRRVWVHTC